MYWHQMIIHQLSIRGDEVFCQANSFQYLRYLVAINFCLERDPSSDNLQNCWESFKTKYCNARKPCQGRNYLTSIGSLDQQFRVGSCRKKWDHQQWRIKSKPHSQPQKSLVWHFKFLQHSSPSNIPDRYVFGTEDVNAIVNQQRKSATLCIGVFNPLVASFESPQSRSHVAVNQTCHELLSYAIMVVQRKEQTRLGAKVYLTVYPGGRMSCDLQHYRVDRFTSCGTVV